MDNIIDMFDKLGIAVIIDENEVMHFFNKDTKKELSTYDNGTDYNLSSIIGSKLFGIFDFDKNIAFSFDKRVIGIEKNGDTVNKKLLLVLKQVSICHGHYENGEFIQNNEDNYSVNFSFDFVPHNFDINKVSFDNRYIFKPDINGKDSSQAYNNNAIINCKKGNDRIEYVFFANGMALIKKNGYRISFENGFQEGDYLSKNDACEMIKNDDLLPIFVDYFANIFPAAKKCIEYVNENSKNLN